MTGQQYKVIAVQDNDNDVDKTNDNGMQAMAVAPYVNGKADTSQIVIAYAGTNFADIRDVDTDIQTVIFGSKDTLVQGNVQQGELPRFTVPRCFVNDYWPFFGCLYCYSHRCRKQTSCNYF
ncbi:hypothetical protein [Streptococcus suis]|uniref:hypothetical protein n=1 Tax=Streptococcus suis TaxID=1307 RepID=UPI00069C4A84|nr:hypothetical protein [Streptococcus suis]HEL1613596.1 hypothetical protein [Streptococcus suis]